MTYNSGEARKALDTGDARAIGEHLRAAMAKIERLQNVCGEADQFAGPYDTPEQVLAASELKFGKIKADIERLQKRIEGFGADSKGGEPPA